MTQPSHAVVVYMSKRFNLWIDLREFMSDVRRVRGLPDRVHLVGNAWERGG